MRLGHAVVIGCLVFLGGCVPGTATTMIDIGIVNYAESKHAFIHAMEKGYTRYQKDLAATDCPRNEYQLSPEIVEYARSRPPYGLDKAIDMLMEIYWDQNQSNRVRSHALYHVAVATMRRREANYSLAESYLMRIGEEFPGTHDCVIEYLLTEINERKKFLQFDQAADV